MMRRMKKLLVLVCIFLVMTGFTYKEEKQRVFDYANLLTRSEREEEEEKLKNQSMEDRIDYAFISANSLQGYRAQEYMELFISQNQIGYDKVDGNAALLLIDLQSKQVWIGVNGETEEIISEMDTSNIVSDILPYVQKNDFSGAIEIFAHDIHSRLEEKQEQEKTAQKVERERGRAGEEDFGEEDVSEDLAEEKGEGILSNPLICLLLGAVLSGGVVFFMITSGKSTMQVGADTYTTDARVNPYTKQDIFLRTVTQKIKREQKERE